MILIRRNNRGLLKPAIWASTAFIVIAAASIIYFLSGIQDANNRLDSLPEREGKKKLSISDLRELAKKGNTLSFKDFSGFSGVDVSSNWDYHIMLYGVEGGYRLIVRTDGEKIDEARLERISDSGGNGIDIRYDDVDEFIRNNPSSEAMRDLS